MPNRVRSRPELADIIALARALEQDERRPAGEIKPWEGEVARALPIGGEKREQMALAWLDAYQREDEAVGSVHRRAETALHLTGFVVIVIGLLLGWGATLGAFYFDGSGRVNAVLVLALLVVIPAVLLLPFAIAAMPADVIARIPGAGLLAAIARGASAGRLALFAWRLFPRELRDTLALLSGRMEKHRRLYATLQKWALLRWSQLFAVAFQIAALAATMVLVVFTDLAFGWSTTLTTGDAARDAQRVHRITSAMAAPWHWAFPEASPSLELIAESRYYRVAAEPVSRAQAARLGDWWKFIVFAMAAYGLLPRLVTLGVARARLRAAARTALLVAPGLSAVLRRIHRSQVETIAVQPEFTDTPVERRVESAVRVASGRVGAVVNWSGVPLDTAAVAAAFPEARLFAAGGSSAIGDDAALVRQLAEITGGKGGDVTIVVKAWEPPLMEFIDFVKMLRDALPAGSTTITVLPAGLDGGAGLGGATAPQLKLWRDKLATVGDPWLRVASNSAEAQA